MSKESEKILTTGEPVSEYSVQLSDGNIYSHQNQGDVFSETDAWIHTYGSLQDIAAGTKAAITPMDWIGMALICFILPAVLSWLIAIPMRKKGWIKENDLKLDL